MIDFFYYASPNARKVLIALEECGLEYTIHWIDISKGEQFNPEYLAINLNAKIPAIVDHNGPGAKALPLFESGAILEYLADKTGKLLPTDHGKAWQAKAWVYWQAANQGPMTGQATHFLQYAPESNDTYARDRYVRACNFTYEVLESHLQNREYLVDEFSIADIMCFPWTRVAKGHGVNLADYPNVKAWSERIKTRPSCQVKIADNRDESSKKFNYTEEQKKILFGIKPKK